MKPITVDNRGCIRHQISDYYRNLIRSGELAEGTALPSARNLARELGVAESNVHYALAELAREGLIARRQRSGSVVIARMGTLREVGFYIPWLHTRSGDLFTHLLGGEISNELKKRSIACRVIYETPSEDGQMQLSAVRHRVQGLILRSINAEMLEFCRTLQLPFSGISRCGCRNGVSLFDAGFAARTAEMITGGGCRSVGIIDHSDWGGFFREKFSPLLSGKLERAGVELRPEWVFDSRRSGKCADNAEFAWNAGEYFRKLPAKPQALMLISDNLIHGLSLCFYRHRVEIPRDFRIFVHHTRENPVLLPFECTLLQHSITEIAAALVEKLIAAAAGKSRPRIPLSLRVSRYKP